MEESHEEAEIQEKTLRQEKVGLSTKMYVQERKRFSKKSPQESWSKIEAEKEVERGKTRVKFSLSGFTEKKEAIRLHGLTGRRQRSNQHCNRIRASCVVFVAIGVERVGGPDGKVVNVNGVADGGRLRCRDC